MSYNTLLLTHPNTIILSHLTILDQPQHTKKDHDPTDSFVFPTLTIIWMTMDKHYKLHMLQNTTTLIINTTIKCCTLWGQNISKNHFYSGRISKATFQSVQTKMYCSTTINRCVHIKAWKQNITQGICSFQFWVLPLQMLFQLPKQKLYGHSVPALHLEICFSHWSVNQQPFNNTMQSTILHKAQTHTHEDNEQYVTLCIGHKNAKSSPKLACASPIVSTALPLYV